MTAIIYRLRWWRYSQAHRAYLWLRDWVAVEGRTLITNEASLHKNGSRTPCENTWPDYDRDPGDPPHPIACSCSGRGWYGVDDGRSEA